MSSGPVPAAPAAAAAPAVLSLDRLSLSFGGLRAITELDLQVGDREVVSVIGPNGAGKTTILNRVLGAQHQRRVGVIINELGRIDIDTRLVKSRSGDVMELAGGCVCHEVRVQSEQYPSSTAPQSITTSSPAEISTSRG